MSKISVIIKEPGKKPRHTHISNTLKNLQNIVGGYIEVVRIADNAAFIVNEEGLILDMHYCFSCMGYHLFGPVILVGVDGEEFCDCPIDYQSLKKVIPQMFVVESST